jgi:hypothetical protein
MKNVIYFKPTAVKDIGASLRWHAGAKIIRKPSDGDSEVGDVIIAGRYLTRMAALLDAKIWCGRANDVENAKEEQIENKTN